MLIICSETGRACESSGCTKEWQRCNQVQKNAYCSLTDLELIQKADEIIDDLIKSGGKSFQMYIPARPNEDADLILSTLNQRFKKLVEEKLSNA